MNTIASIKFDQTINDYMNTLYNYMFSIGNLSTYTVYDEYNLVAKPTVFQTFLPYFKNYTTKITLDKKYYQKPNLFAFDYYGASELEWLVLFVAGVSHPIDFTLPIIEVLPVSILSDINKLVTVYKKDIQNSKNNPQSYTSQDIDISKQVGFVEQRYLYKNTSNLYEKLLKSSTKNRVTSTTISAGQGQTANTNRTAEANTVYASKSITRK